MARVLLDAISDMLFSAGFTPVKRSINCVRQTTKSGTIQFFVSDGQLFAISDRDDFTVRYASYNISNPTILSLIIDFVKCENRYRCQCQLNFY